MVGRDLDRILADRNRISGEPVVRGIELLRDEASRFHVEEVPGRTEREVGNGVRQPSDLRGSEGREPDPVPLRLNRIDEEDEAVAVGKKDRPAVGFVSRFERSRL
jgi:hypothetical protein